MELFNFFTVLTVIIRKERQCNERHDGLNGTHEDKRHFKTTNFV